jgi:CRISPR-associated protein Csm2
MKKIVLDYRKDNELFSATAKEWAEGICARRHERADCRVKSTQLRNFYDKVMELEDRSRHEAFEEVIPFVKMLNSKVAYARTRGHVSNEFVDMMTQCIAQVDSPASLRTFKLFFEALIGFYPKK